MLQAVYKSKVVGMTTWEDVKCEEEKDEEYRSLVSQVRDATGSRSTESWW